MSAIPIGLELYSVRREFAKDPDGTLAAVKAMGYTGVEFAGPPALSGAELRGLLDKHGLVCCGWHTPYDAVQDATLAATVALNRTVGNTAVIVPGLPGELTRTRADWLKVARFFNSLAERLAGEGMATGYHNHTAEFAPLEGEAPWDVLFANTDLRVIMQLDTGNALCGGGDCAAILARYPGRAVTVHLKPYRVGGTHEEGFRPLIGDDSVPWQKVFRLCRGEAGTRWFIVEYESDAHPPLEAVKLCLQRLHAMGL